MRQQNGVAERRNRTLLDMVGLMMSYFDLPKFLWGYTLKIVADILNSIPTKSILNTPVELWASKPSLQHCRIWGCTAYVLKKKIEKLKTKSELCYL